MAENPDAAAVDAAIVTVQRCIDATWNAALCAVRIADLGPADIPRICVSASCRSVEQMIEAYRRRRPQASDDEKRRRQAEIQDAALDLVAALTEGLQMAQNIATAAADEERLPS